MSIGCDLVRRKVHRKIGLTACDPKVMGKQTIGPVLTVLGWITTVAMSLALIGLAYGALTR